MKRYIRFDSVGGASGDMILAALAAVGADLTTVEEQLNRFFPEHLRIQSEAAAGSGLNGIRVSVHAHHHHQQHDESHWTDAEQSQGEHSHHHHHHHHHHTHRGLLEISGLINGSTLSDKTKQLAITIFQRLAKAEAKIHGSTPEAVHFHEVGAWDSVADIVGACIALEQLNVAGVSCGALPAGTGTIQCAHGVMPNPAPATQLLMEGQTMMQTDEPCELVTPTGAAILTTWMHELEAPPACAIPLSSGFGFGSHKLQGRPNVLRATLLKEPAKEDADLPYDPAKKTAGTPPQEHGHTLTLLETNLDDCNPEWLGTLLEELLEIGALDVWHTPIIMKKGRPAIQLSVLAEPNSSESCKTLIFKSTTTFGIRSSNVTRAELERQFMEVETAWGRVSVKCGILNGQTITLAPEHDCCASLAKAAGITVKEVSTAAALIAGDKKRTDS
ncbi:MAG: nickel pincer cofactor biosynthesis protein LarC [Kiritimatiellia bacterium]